MIGNPSAGLSTKKHEDDVSVAGEEVDHVLQERGSTQASTEPPSSGGMGSRLKIMRARLSCTR